MVHYSFCFTFTCVCVCAWTLSISSTHLACHRRWSASDQKSLDHQCNLRRVFVLSFSFFALPTFLAMLSIYQRTWAVCVCVRVCRRKCRSNKWQWNTFPLCGVEWVRADASLLCHHSIYVHAKCECVYYCNKRMFDCCDVLMFSHETYQLDNGSLMVSKFPFLYLLQFQFFTNLCFRSRLLSLSLATSHLFTHRVHLIIAVLFITVILLDAIFSTLHSCSSVLTEFYAEGE